MSKVFGAMGVILFFGAVLAGALRCADLHEHEANKAAGRTGPDQAKKWAAKFGADGPVDCVRDGYLYRCTVAKNGVPIALECWTDGCAIQGPPR